MHRPRGHMTYLTKHKKVQSNSNDASLVVRPSLTHCLSLSGREQCPDGPPKSRSSTAD